MISEVIILILLGTSISFMFYAAHMRDKVIEFENNEDILVSCLEKSATNLTEEVLGDDKVHAGRQSMGAKDY